MKERILMLCAAAAMAFSTIALSQSARDQYARDRAFCNSGQSSQDRATCLREAGAALQEAPRGNLTDTPSAEQNKFARCEYHKDPQDRHYCMLRMKGEGTVTGSIDGGGLMRELRVVEPVQQQ